MAESDGLVLLPVFLIAERDADNVGLMELVPIPSDVLVCLEELQIMHPELFCTSFAFDGEVPSFEGAMCQIHNVFRYCVNFPCYILYFDISFHEAAIVC